MRNIPQAALDILAGECPAVFALIQLQTPTPICATNCHRIIEHNGISYRSDTGLQEFPAVNQEFTLNAAGVSLSFADDTQSLISMALNNDVFDSQLDIHIAILSPVDDSVVHVIESVYRGYLSEPQPTDHGITFTFKNHLAKFEKTAGRRTNSPSQQRFYPNDIGLDIITEVSGDFL